jgi:hypothetical protein
LGREQEEEEKKKRLMEKAARSSQSDELEEVEIMDFDIPQAETEMGQETQNEMKKNFDEEMIEVDSALEKEKEEMKKVD